MSKYNTLPRTDLTYCYICNARILTFRCEGESDELRRRFGDQLAQNFLQLDDFDIVPITCDQPYCLDQYLHLPQTRYPEENVAYDRSVTFDGGSLFGFPQRYGLIEGIDENAEHAIDLKYYPARISELEPLFQAWLFFGFLNEILGPQFFNQDDYIGADENGNTVIKLAPLPNIVSQWMLATAQSAKMGVMHRAQLSKAITLLRKMLISVHIGSSTFDKRLQNLIAATGEIISLATQCLYPEYRDTQSFSPLWSASSLRKAHPFNASPMSQISVVTIALKTLSYEIGTKQTKQTNKYGLQASNTLQSQGEPMHRAECIRHNCSLIRVDHPIMEQMCSFLEGGTFPLLKVSRNVNDNIEIDVVPWDKGVGFVAISHVWAQGMGNEYDNSLQECQVRNLHSLVSHLWGVVDPKDERFPLFWLDTFCCPITDSAPEGEKVATKKARAEKRFKDISLARMRTVYSVATAVLVVDTELEQIATTSCSPIELLAQLFSCHWVTRLWTLQEAALPEELWIRFRDRPLNIDSLFRALRGVYRSTNIRDRSAAWNAISLFRSLRLICGRYTLPSREQEIGVTAIGLSGRAVTYQHDEAICLATLLDLDPSAILASNDTEHRMKGVWDQLSVRGLIPRSIAFAFGDKLSLPGYSWALSTFLQQAATLAFTEDSTIKANVTEQGLLLPASGITISMATPLVGFEQHYLDEIVRPPDGLAVKISETLWVQFSFAEYGKKLSSFLGRPETSILPSGNLFLENVFGSNKTLALLRAHLSTQSSSNDDGKYLLVEIVDEATVQRRPELEAEARTEAGAEVGVDGNPDPDHQSQAATTRNPTLFCKRLCVGVVAVVSAPVSHLSTAACRHADELRNHDDFKALAQYADPPENEDDVLARRLAHEKLRPYFTMRQKRKYADYMAEGNNQRDIQADKDYATLVAVALSGRYATSVTQYPETQMWCIG